MVTPYGSAEEWEGRFLLPQSLCYSRVKPFGTNVANPTDEDNINGGSEQIHLTNMRASGAPRRSQEAPLASIFISWICEEPPIIGICQLDLQHYTIYGVGRTVTCIRLSNLCRSITKGMSDDCPSNAINCLLWHMQLKSSRFSGKPDKFSITSEETSLGAAAPVRPTFNICDRNVYKKTL